MAYLEFAGKLGIQKARIWLDELPSTAILSNEAARESHIFECGSAIALRRLVAIEVFQGRYGLLGAEPANSTRS